MTKEATARIKINHLLEESGWRFFDNEFGPANIQLEANVKITKSDINELGEDFDKTKSGFIDFLLLDPKGFPLAVLEAKRENIHPLEAKEQARDYAIGQKVKFVILSNGNSHYLWNIEQGNPTPITKFPTPDSIGEIKDYKPIPNKLIQEKVAADYIAISQSPLFKEDPRWLDSSTRRDYLDESGLRLLRPYQLDAIHHLQKAVQNNKNRFLFEMATGTGKTLVSAAVIKLFLKTGNAKRVLFLVDRLELEDQANKNFVKYLKNDFTTIIYKENRNNWRNAEIVVTTIQSLTTDNKYRKLFSPTDFDLVISDEAHRSISGNSRAVFEYFVGYKLGLTATPKNYLKNIDPTSLNEKDVRAWEQRQLLDTYITFGCENGEPTFRYTLLDGVNDGILINPIVVDARTDITTQLLSDDGYSMMVTNDEGDEEEAVFKQRDFERKFFSEKTNAIFCKTFFENALKDPISHEIGKTIIFCVSQFHAMKITQMLNEMAYTLWPDKYNSDFAIQVTSHVSDAQQFTINFANNNLSGHTKFIEGYKSSKTRVCVTVGMMTTGYDCTDILNICLMRPIFSPSDFVQIKGRGTRKHWFKMKFKDTVPETSVAIDKENFKLFDFFANCEYFEEKFNYDEVLTLPPTRTSPSTGGPTGTVIDEVNIYIPDPLKTIKETKIGNDGMRIDREYFESFGSKVISDPFIKAKVAEGNFEEVEEYIKQEIFNKPSEYFDLEKLQTSAKVDRKLSLREVIDKVFGFITEFKTKNEVLEDECSNFMAIHKPENKYVLAIKNFMKTYITDQDFRQIIEKKNYAELNTYTAFSMQEWIELNGYRDVLPQYIKDYVPLSKYG